MRRSQVSPSGRSPRTGAGPYSWNSLYGDGVSQRRGPPYRSSQTGKVIVITLVAKPERRVLMLENLVTIQESCIIVNRKVINGGPHK